MNIRYRDSSASIAEIKADLDEIGATVLRFADAINLLEFIQSIGGKSRRNNLEDSNPLWEVKPQPVQNQLIRSLTNQEFNLHTDASFEKNPPQYIAIFVVRQDRMGCGKTIICDSREIIPRLNQTSKDVLSAKFRFKVPPEYFKGKDANISEIIQGNRIRFRREILCNLDENQKDAVNDFETISTLLQHTFLLERFELLLLDNHRILHGRTKIVDTKRHLQRIRFDF